MTAGMKRCSILLFFLAVVTTVFAQSRQSWVRKPVDPVGFATKAWQMDSVMARIERDYGSRIDSCLERIGMRRFNQWKTVICPHDDYTYASWLYPAALRNVKAQTVILIGVAHKAKKFKLEDRMVFGSFEKWSEPYGQVSVSQFQAKLTNGLPASTWIIHDSLMAEEHSLEAIVPFLQYYNRNINIIPILVPYMSFSTMQGLSLSLAKAIYDVMQDNGLLWGRDIAIVISNDAVHYGDEEWGGNNYAKFGADSAGYQQAVAFEKELIASTLTGSLKKKKIEDFFKTAVDPNDYKEYQWTWCGRYAVPFGLLVTESLSGFTHSSIKGLAVSYKTSIDDHPVRVEDLKMGTTAIATLRHWVGYAAIGYK
jgi:AmmeMemoRadiSam system protein B